MTSEVDSEAGSSELLSPHLSAPFQTAAHLSADSQNSSIVAQAIAIPYNSNGRNFNNKANNYNTMVAIT